MCTCAHARERVFHAQLRDRYDGGSSRASSTGARGFILILAASAGREAGCEPSGIGWRHISDIPTSVIGPLGHRKRIRILRITHSTTRDRHVPLRHQVRHRIQPPPIRVLSWRDARVHRPMQRCMCMQETNAH